MSTRNYWIGVVSKGQAEAMIAAGFAEVNRGKAGPLERMREGDGFALYSPRTEDPDGDRVQAFTAIGCVAGGRIVQAHSTDGSPTFRRGVRYLPAIDAPVRPLIESLSFIRSKLHWGAPFRYGFIRISEDDFARIAAAMGRDFTRDFPRVETPALVRESSAVPA
jgi:EVE domain-containing protein